MNSPMSSSERIAKMSLPTDANVDTRRIEARVQASLGWQRRLVSLGALLPIFTLVGAARLT